jgi:hypothetical protein
MKSAKLVCITALTLFTLLTIPVRLAAQVGGSGTTNYIPIWTDSTTLGDSIIYQTGGMVGIGTISPAATLNVVGPNGTTGNAPTVLQVTGGTPADGGLGGWDGGSVALTGGNGSFGAVRPGTGGSVTLTGGAGPASKGTTAGAGGVLQLNAGPGGWGKDQGAGGPGGSIMIAAGAGGFQDLGRGGAGGSITLQPGTGHIAPSGNLLVRLTQGGKMEILGGRVGIGTPSPKATLDIRAGSTTLADAWTTRSSRRFKSNIQPLEGALEKVAQLQGVSYERKADGKHEIGVVAEDVDHIVPEIVSRDPETNEVQGVDYSRLAALLIEAVKSQQAEIQHLKAQVDQLTSNRAVQ